MRIIAVHPGYRFGRLFVVKRNGVRPNGSGFLKAWDCLCDCGVKLTTTGRSLITGNTKSCGCFARDNVISRNTTHGLSRSTEYKILHGMKKRCTNPKDKKYSFYGARGIKVCDRWSDVENFVADMGPRPSVKHSIDRYPNKNGDYAPDNCRWATQKEQCRNTRRNRAITMDGKTLCVSEWCETLGLSPQRVNVRIQRGMEPSLALTKPFFPVGRHPRAKFNILPIGTITQ